MFHRLQAIQNLVKTVKNVLNVFLSDASQELDDNEMEELGIKIDP